MKAKKTKKARAEPRTRPQAERATPATIEQRISALLQIRLDGAEWWDCRNYVVEKEASGEAPWTVEEGCKGLSDTRIREYIAAADKLISESCRITRREALRKHKAQRRSLYARAVQSGDIRTALAVLSDLAELQDLYPAKKVHASGKIHVNHYADLTDDEIEADIARLEALESNSDPASPASPGSPPQP